MNIHIERCNNIDSADIIIYDSKLNIKYAINGTGKTSISKAIEYSIDKSKDINDLLPLKFRDLDKIETKNQPLVKGIEKLQKIAVFNEDYVNQYVFKTDEIIQNSFEIFIKNQDYEQRMDQIDESVQKLRITFKDSEGINQLIEDLNTLSDCFGKSNSGYSKAGAIEKGIGKGNKLISIPVGLEAYKDYLQSDSNTQWLKWQINGNKFIDIDSKCPYCTSEILSKKTTVLLVEKEYNPNAIENLNKVIDVFQKLRKYFSDETNKNIDIITHNINGLTEDQKNYLIKIKREIDDLLNRLESLRNIGYFSFKDIQKVVDFFKEKEIDIQFYPFLDTNETKKIIEKINQSIEEILNKAGKLQGEINQLKISIRDTISKYTNEINEFLKYAGYKYYVAMELENDEYRMRLKHFEYGGKIEKVGSYLSFGERNAFSLILFMYDTIKNGADLIILDDPVSSFDNNKKFAIINKLFKGNNTFQNKTVLILTHDFEQIIDMEYTFYSRFQPYVTFLQNDDGIIDEIEIKKGDIRVFSDIAQENILSLDEDIIKLIYLRKLYEFNSDKSEAYHLLSNLFHKRQNPIKRTFIENSAPIEDDMTTEEIKKATNEIKEAIPEFSYPSFLNIVDDNIQMVEIYKNAKNNYEKLQIYRIIFDDESNGNNNAENAVIKKFINESYHIENDYIMQLNPCKYQLIPQYIINLCNEDIETIK